MHTGCVKPPPDWLPKANSRKWHGRRWWDSLGYLRVRSLANPQWHRDAPWLLHVIEDTRPSQPGHRRDALDAIIHELRRYRDLPNAAGPGERERQWDRMLDALDRYLLICQEEHLAAVDAAGRSGRGQ